MRQASHGFLNEYAACSHGTSPAEKQTLASAVTKDIEARQLAASTTARMAGAQMLATYATRLAETSEAMGGVKCATVQAEVTRAVAFVASLHESMAAAIQLAEADEAGAHASLLVADALSMHARAVSTTQCAATEAEARETVKFYEQQMSDAEGHLSQAQTAAVSRAELATGAACDAMKAATESSAEASTGGGVNTHSAGDLALAALRANDEAKACSASAEDAKAILVSLVSILFIHL